LLLADDLAAVVEQDVLWQRFATTSSGMSPASLVSVIVRPCASAASSVM